MNKLLKIMPLGLLMPFLAFAIETDPIDPEFAGGWLAGLVTFVSSLVNALIPVVIAIGLLFFIWGLVQYIAASGDESAKDEGKRKMIWGVITLFIIVAVWGLVAILAGIFGVTIGDNLADTPGITITP